MEGKVAGAQISIAYSSPAVKERSIWGELVPYGKVWQAGANEATIFTTDRDVKIGDKTLPTGSYSLFVLPENEQWTFIFNSQTGQWVINKSREANLDRSKDVIEYSVKPEKLSSTQENLVMI